MRENDIYIRGDYSLDDLIRSADFIDLTRQAVNISDMPFRYYYYSYDSSKDSDFLTREEAANLILKNLGWEKLINLDIFTTKFADEADFAGGIGGAAILQGLGVMQGSDGYFYPARSLTYGETYAIAYELAVMSKDDEPDNGIMPLE